MDREHPYVIFSDLDGTLLDAARYSHHEARPSLEALRARGVPLVLCTSKTFTEVDAARAEIGSVHPFAVENGGAIFIPTGYFPFPVPGGESASGFEVIRLGLPYPMIVAALRRASEASGCRVRGFHDMSSREVAVQCQLTLQAAERAKTRDYDEPFLLLSESPAEICGLLAQLEAQGLAWTRGDRFYHVHGPHSKGRAARLLIDLFRRSRQEIVTVGLGNAPNDVPLLESVDVPVVIPSGARLDLHPWYADRRSWRIAPLPGPRGWNQAVSQLLKTPPWTAAALS